MAVSKRIPVSEELWERLGQMKKSGQTYDELLREIIQKAHHEELADRMDEIREMDENELTALEDL